MRIRRAEIVVGLNKLNMLAGAASRSLPAGLSLFLLITASAFVAACGRDGGPSVVLYVSADEHIARQVITAFEQQTGVHVLMVGDSEAKKTTGLVERLRAEKENPQADVFWSSEIFMTVELADDGVLESYQSATTRDWPLSFRDPQSRWFGFGCRARVIVYAPDRVSPDDVPKTWMDLTRGSFKGRIVMADPRFGTTGGHLAVMKTYWDQKVMPGYYRAFIEGLAENRIRLLPSGNAGVVEAVARGEADLGMTDTDDVWAAQTRGLNVKCVCPAHSIERGATGVGTLQIPNTVAKVKGGPNPEQAKLLIDFLLSEQVERLLAQSVSHNVPIRPALAAEFSQYTIPDPLVVNWTAAAANRTTAIQQAMRAFDSVATEREPPSTTQPESEPDSQPQVNDHAP